MNTDSASMYTNYFANTQRRGTTTTCNIDRNCGSARAHAPCVRVCARRGGAATRFRHPQHRPPHYNPRAKRVFGTDTYCCQRRTDARSRVQIRICVDFMCVNAQRPQQTRLLPLYTNKTQTGNNVHKPHNKKLTNKFAHRARRVLWF